MVTIIVNIASHVGCSACSNAYIIRHIFSARLKAIRFRRISEFSVLQPQCKQCYNTRVCYFWAYNWEITKKDTVGKKLEMPRSD